MRNVFACVICGVHYLPPESMIYPETGIVASPAHCANPDCAATAATGGAGLPLGVLEAMALQAAIQAEEPPQRATGRARGQRAAAAPGGRRGKLR